MRKFIIIVQLTCLLLPGALFARQGRPHSVVDSLAVPDSLKDRPKDTLKQGAVRSADLLIASIDTISLIADSNIIFFDTVETDPASLQVPDSSSGKSGKNRGKLIKTQYGVASFYSNKFEGRKTYTDEIFSQKKLSAASNTLPMHTWVRVTNLRNHRSVILRINDKMHPRNRRLIDLSRAAARKLGFTGSGLARVRVNVLGRKKPADATAD